MTGRNIRTFLVAAAMLFGVLAAPRASAQHTLGFTAGYGMGTGRFNPKQEMRGMWGMYGGGLTWRYYGKQRFVGGFGVDLEFLQQGFSFATNTAAVEEKKDYLYYTRNMNTVMLPVVWQPHIYLFKNRMRVYLDAAVFFSYNISSTFINEQGSTVSPEQSKGPWRGEYDFKVVRDNRWGYGLAGGGGVAVLVKQLEFSVRVRYYFGYSDLLRNHNKYAGNTTDGYENPFYTTPQRSPLDNLTFSIGVSYRFNKSGFTEWNNRPPKRDKNKEVFNYKGVTK